MARAGLFATIRTEGLLLPSDTLALIGGSDGSALPGLGAESYHLGQGETISACITRSWNTLLGRWAAFRSALGALAPTDHTATTLTREQWLLPLFRELGYGWLQPVRSALTVGDVAYPVSHIWEGRLPLHLVGARVDVGKKTPDVRGAARMSPHSLVQELLNRSPEHLWGVVSNGLQLRLLRDNASLTRQAFVEWDLEALFDGEVYPDFVVLWKTLHESRFEGERPAECWTERWANESSARGVRALEDLRAGVEKALEALGRGLVTHPANSALRRSLADGALDAQGLYGQLMRVLYRLIFLAVAEERELLHDPEASAETRSRYERYYSFRRLRRLAERRTGTAHGDLWQSLGVVRRALAAPGLVSLGLSGLGSMLWSDGACLDLENAELANRDLLAAVRALSLVEDKSVHQLRPVDYRNLGPEELGSVYESLLELHPAINPGATDPADAFRLGSGAGNERKTTGSYYTPSSLIAKLLDSALDPVLDEAVARPERESALLGLSVVDPACGSGHFLIAAARRIARRLASVRTEEPEPSPEALRSALRDVIGHCVHGVDLNPMAAELCKVGLWMEALEPGKPLSFLDHRIVVGNSLLGTTPELMDEGIPDEAFAALAGDDKAVAAEMKKRNKAERKQGQAQLWAGWSAEAERAALASEVSRVDELPDDTVEGIKAKESRWAELDAGERRVARLRADAWCAAFVLPKREWTIQFTDGVWRALVGNPAGASQPALDAVEEARKRFGFLHWHIEFPDVMAKGGFDIVLGNPPWDKVEFHEKEFFAKRDPDIADAAGAKRKRLIAELEASDPALWAAYQGAYAHTEAEAHFVRDSGRFPLCGQGRLNTYALFAETMRSLVGPAGRAGVIVPTGIATDDTTKAFFGAINGGRELAGLYDFENRAKLFPDIDSRIKFCLLTLSGRGRPVKDGAELAFFCHDASDLDDPERRFRLSPDEIALLNPNTLTCPIFRTKRDAEITLQIYRRAPVLMRESGSASNPWSISFRQGLFNMATDSALFQGIDRLKLQGYSMDNGVLRKGAESCVRLFEGKMIGLYDHRAADVIISPTATIRQRQPRYLSGDDHRDPARVALSEAWIEERVLSRELSTWTKDWLLGFCKVTSPTNERTMVSTIFPRAGAGDSVNLIFPPSAREAVLLQACLSSFSFDYVVRQKLGGINLSFFVVAQLAIPAPDVLAREAPWLKAQSIADWIIPRVLELDYTSTDLKGLAMDLGYDGPPFLWDEKRRVPIRAELDACFFHLYGLERDEVDYVMGTFPIVERHETERFGEYRTKSLILECYDALAKAADTGEPHASALDPPAGTTFVEIGGRSTMGSRLRTRSTGMRELGDGGANY